jgi:ABC-type nitrate/sulfonate/bicarbonate transport system ATPase subunit
VFLSERVIVLTKAPGRVKEEIKIGLPKKRDRGILETVEFTEYVSKFRRALFEK